MALLACEKTATNIQGAVDFFGLRRTERKDNLKCICRLASQFLFACITFFPSLGFNSSKQWDFFLLTNSHCYSNIEPAVNQHPQISFCRAALQTLLSQCILVLGITLSQVQNLAFILVQSHVKCLSVLHSMLLSIIFPGTEVYAFLVLSSHPSCT